MGKKSLSIKAKENKTLEIPTYLIQTEMMKSTLKIEGCVPMLISPAYIPFYILIDIWQLKGNYMYTAEHP